MIIMVVVLPPMHILSQLLIHSCQCLCSAPYMRNGQQLEEEGSIISGSSKSILMVKVSERHSRSLQIESGQAFKINFLIKI